MSTRKTTAEKIEAARIEKAQADARIKKLLQEQKEADRKARTKRLIERGAIAESLILGADMLTHEQFKAFLEKTVTSSYATRALAEIVSETVAITDEKTTAIPAQAAATPDAVGGSKTENEARQAG